MPAATNVATASPLSARSSQDAAGGGDRRKQLTRLRGLACARAEQQHRPASPRCARPRMRTGATTRRLPSGRRRRTSSSGRRRALDSPAPGASPRASETAAPAASSPAPARGHARGRTRDADQLTRDAEGVLALEHARARAQHAAVQNARPLARGGEQRALADTGRPFHQRHRPSPRERAREQFIDARQLCAALQQDTSPGIGHGGSVSHEDRAPRPAFRLLRAPAGGQMSVAM